MFPREILGVGELSLTYNLGGCSIFMQHTKKMTDKNLHAKPKAEEILFTFLVASKTGVNFMPCESIKG